LFQQGGSHGETWDWVQQYWAAHFLRDQAIWDETGMLGGTQFAQPDTGLPFGRQFILRPDGTLALPHFGHAPVEVIPQVYAAYGGDGDGDGLHDVWERLFLVGFEADGWGDGDGDGSANVEEFAAGTDPSLRSSFLDIRLRKDAGTVNLTFMARPADEWWNQGRTRRYAVLQGPAPPGPWNGVPGLEALEGQGTLVVPLPPGEATAHYLVEARLDP